MRVWWEDTDAGGIVYYANYLRFIERGRSEMLRQAGIDQLALQREGLIFVVTRIEAEFLRPARLDDLLEVRTSIAGTGAVRLTLGQSVWRNNSELFRAVVTLAALGPEGRPVRLSAELRSRFDVIGSERRRG
jgi:acyl-CoA thioester hydrolase